MWGLRPRLGVEPLHPVLSLVAIAIDPETHYPRYLPSLSSSRGYY
jgi:hypothetical protein